MPHKTTFENSKPVTKSKKRSFLFPPKTVFRILNDHHEEIKKLLLSIKEVLERQAQAQSPRLEELRARRDAPCSPIRESSISPLSSERGTPIPTGDRIFNPVFECDVILDVV